MAKRKVRVEFDVDGIVERGASVVSKALDRVVQRMTETLKTAYEVKGPPRSVPGQFPRQDTGRLHDTVKVERKGRKVWVSLPIYGVYLDQGFIHARGGYEVKRPGYTNILFKRDKSAQLNTSWVKQINRESRALLKKVKKK